MSVETNSNSNATAMRTASGTAVFVNSSGEYSEVFPSDNIIRRSNGTDTVYKVFGFVGSDEGLDFEEQYWTVENERDALQFATCIYGNELEEFDRSGEVFDVEVHEVDRSEIEA